MMQLPSIEQVVSLLPDQLSRLVELGAPWLSSYGLPALLLGTALETFFLTGVLLPGFALIVAGGYLAAAGILPLGPAFAVALAGALLGDQLSYALGRYGSARLLRRYSAATSRFGAALRSEGPILLLLYHYSPVLRSVVPLACGHTRYHWLRFSAWTLAGAALWVGLVSGIGYFAHEAQSGRGNLMLLLVDGLALAFLLYSSWRIARRLRLHDEAGTPAENDSR